MRIVLLICLLFLVGCEIPEGFVFDSVFVSQNKTVSVWYYENEQWHVGEIEIEAGIYELYREANTRDD